MLARKENSCNHEEIPLERIVLAKKGLVSKEEVLKRMAKVVGERRKEKS